MDVVGQGWFYHWVPPSSCYLKEYPIGWLRQVIWQILFMHTPQLYQGLSQQLHSGHEWLVELPDYC
jgi:hypothetical protein